MDGISIKQARQKKGMSQVQLADAIGISREYMSQIERGKRKVPKDRASELAQILSIPEGEVYAWVLGEPLKNKQIVVSNVITEHADPGENEITALFHKFEHLSETDKAALRVLIQTIDKEIDRRLKEENEGSPRP